MPFAIAPKRKRSAIRLGTDFSGMDMPARALMRLGVQFIHAFASDTAKHCREYMRGVSRPRHIFHDVCNRDVRSVPKTDLYVWGAPCQPFSSAGKGRGERDPHRGDLAKHALRYIHTHRPTVTVMENVQGLVSRHKGTFLKIVKALATMDYTVNWSIVNTQDHGIPQHRQRLWLVAIATDKIARPFSWPASVGIKLTAESLLVPLLETESPMHLPDKVTQLRARSLVKVAYKKLLKKGINPKVRTVFTDIGCSQKYATHSVDRMQCVTASRASGAGWWVSSRGRALNLVELFHFQGVIDDIPDWKALNISDRRMAHMLGNSMSLNVCERVLRAALLSAGLIGNTIKDPWDIMKTPI